LGSVLVICRLIDAGWTLESWWRLPGWNDEWSIADGTPQPECRRASRGYAEGRLGLSQRLVGSGTIRLRRPIGTAEWPGLVVCRGGLPVSGE
jgi:hypothetical protein